MHTSRAVFAVFAVVAGIVLGASSAEAVTWNLSLTEGDIGNIVSAGGSSADVLLSNIMAVSAVPEPGTWAMMILGFVGLGIAFRHRRRMVAMA